jgi:hypothetical protein
MLANPEFQLSIWGSQRLCYGAVYYAYEDFLARCYRLSACEPGCRVDREFGKRFGSQYGAALRQSCWDDHRVLVARLTRHALVHNGGRLTSDLKKMSKHGLTLLGEDIQIYPSLTKGLYGVLKDRVTKFLDDPAGPLGGKAAGAP